MCASPLLLHSVDAVDAVTRATQTPQCGTEVVFQVVHVADTLSSGAGWGLHILAVLPSC